MAPLLICAISVFGAVYALFIGSAPNFAQRIVAFLIFTVIAAVMFGIFYVYSRFVFTPKLNKFYAKCNRKEEIEKLVVEIKKHTVDQRM